MVIDLILDRKDGKRYNPKEFYNGVMSYWQTFQDETMSGICDAMDEGTEDDIKRAISRYIVKHGYNLDIIGYVNKVNWLDE